MTTAPEPNRARAQAELYHAWMLGLMLMVVTRHGAQLSGEWMFRLFRRQHLAKFRSSFDKLGLAHLPDAVACAQYHVLSNQIGGVQVEYMPESNRKAWVRFRYPRWMYAGPTICAMPIEISRGFLRGWYAHNGVSLGNPRLGFVCVSEDMSDQFGLCGYFKEFDHELSEAQRLQFSDERPPPFDAAAQPRLPAQQWNASRLANAQRSYALEYLRNGIVELSELLGGATASELAQRSARLIGMQYYQASAQLVGAVDGGATDAARYLLRMFEDMVDSIAGSPIQAAPSCASIRIAGLKMSRGLPADHAQVLDRAWLGLAQGAVRAHRQLLQMLVHADPDGSYRCDIVPA